jgi:hypothetical protein
MTTPLVGGAPEPSQTVTEALLRLSVLGRPVSGVGLSAVACWVLIAGLVSPISPVWGRLLLVFAAPLWFVAVAVTRRRYLPTYARISTRAGEVNASATPRRSSQVSRLVGSLIVFIAAGVTLLGRGVDAFNVAPLPSGMGYLLVVGCLGATLVLGWRSGREFRDAGSPASLLLVSGMTGSNMLRPGDVALLVGFIGLVGVARGILEHLRFLRLERHVAIASSPPPETRW